MKILDLNNFIGEKMKIVPLSNEDFNKIPDDFESENINIKNYYRLKRGIVDSWNISMDDEKVTICINIDTFLFPFWEKHFEYDNTKWKGVEKYKLHSDVNLNDLGYITIDTNVSDAIEKNYLDVCYPFEEASRFMIEHISNVMKNNFHVEEFGGIEPDDMEYSFGDDFKANEEAYGCWGVVWNNDMFDQVFDDTSGELLGNRNYNIIYGVNYDSPTKNYDTLSETNSVKIIYYISDKELKRPDVDQRQEKFAEKIVEALFGRKYINMLKNKF